MHTRVLRLVLSGLMGALLVVSKQAMSGLPNIEPVTLLIILFALELAERYQVEMPIVQTVNAIVNEGMGAAEAVRTLMDRDPKNELPKGYEK